MCDTKGHDHWCSGCGKNLNKEPMDSYVEIEWSQNEQGEIIQDKKMLCKSCLEDLPNVKALTEFFSQLQYQPWGHVFCSSCKKDLTKEYEDKNKHILPKLGTMTGLRVGTDYECLEFKEHKDKKHFIKVVVLCPDCKKEKLNLEHLEELKKLGRNPNFKPTVTCPNTENCKQFKKGDQYVNCRHIVIGRDTETLNMGLLCGRKHKGALPLPFDDGFAIIRPRKWKGAALANPQVQSLPMSNPVQAYFKDIEKILEKFMKRNKLGKFGEPSDDGKFLIFEARLAAIENKLGIQPAIVVPTKLEPIKSAHKTAGE